MMKRLVLIALAIVAPSAAWAQGPVTVGTTDATVKRIAPGAKFTVPLVVDLSAAGGTSIDSIASSLVWNPAVVTLDSVAPATFGDFSKVSLNRTAGLLDLAALSPTPFSTSGIPVSLATLYFTAGQTGGGTHAGITPTDASLGGVHVASTQLVGWSQDICVAPAGLWGDTDGVDSVTIIDAQQIARAAVGATVINDTTLTNNGDVNGDGEVDILDAQGIARYVVGLSAPARINHDRGAIPDTHTLTMNAETVTLNVGLTTSLAATPFDASGFTLVGCQASTWASSDDAIVHVNATGQITAVSVGTATITATSGTAPPAQSVVTVVP